MKTNRDDAGLTRMGTSQSAIQNNAVLRRKAVILSLLFVSFIALGCRGTQQIETHRPIPSPTVGNPPPLPDRHGFLQVALQLGATALPIDVSQLSFRIESIGLLHPLNGWVDLPAKMHLFELGEGPFIPVSILSTALSASSYDSLRIAITDVYVQFGNNAGSPLTLPKNTPITLSAPLLLEQDERTYLMLHFEAGASLSRNEEGYWYFLPFITTEENSDWNH